jgi:hypothetical protein
MLGSALLASLTMSSMISLSEPPNSAQYLICVTLPADLPSVWPAAQAKLAATSSASREMMMRLTAILLCGL